MVGEVFHGLKLIAHCGGGAYGDVYFCEDISGKKMAVKIVSKKKLGDSWERELKGVKNYRKITENAPALLQIFHIEEDDDCFFYTMEPADSASDSKYIPDTLTHRIQAGPLPQADLFRILSGIFYGIKLIHQAGFTHRDIKPDNILFVKGVPKLADIGLLSSLANTMTVLAGTLEFIPPEERGADSLDSSNKLSRQRNDLYAFGKVIYCAATGAGPNEYPTVPADLSLSLPLKYFLRLSFQLCSKDPLKRLSSIEKLDKEFAGIERKLLYGENFKDRISYLGQILKTILFSAAHFLKRFWYFMLIFILLGSGITYWIKKPEKPVDLAEIKTKTFRSKHANLTMTVPHQWEVLSKETIKKLLAENPPETEQEKNMLDLLNELMEYGFDFIYRSADKKLENNITIQSIPIPGKEFLDRPDDELRYHTKKLFQGSLGFKSEIYEIKRLTIAGKPCIFIDLAHEPGKTRINNYLFPMPDKTVTIAFTGNWNEFDQLKKVFEAVLKTLKFEK